MSVIAATIRQGDQYMLPLVLWQGDTLIEGQDVEAMRVAIGDYTAYYPNGDLTYSPDDGAWLFPLTEEMTYAMQGEVSIQAQATFANGSDTVCISTQNVRVKIGDSTLQGEWID